MARSAVLALALALAAPSLAEVQQCQGGDAEEASLLQSRAAEARSLAAGALPQCEALSQFHSSPCPEGGPMNTGKYCVYNPDCVTGGAPGCVEDTGCQYQDAPQQKCFYVDLVADPVAAPDINTSAKASAEIEVNADSVTVTSLNWTVPDVSSANPIIGLHIHDGDHDQNGGILVGFCGSSPLPAFSGTCPEYTTFKGGASNIAGEGCDLGDAAQGGPCVAAEGTNQTTSTGAAQKILSSTDPYSEFYLNLHTLDSFNTNKAANGGHPNPIGLIRGQLLPVGC